MRTLIVTAVVLAAPAFAHVQVPLISAPPEAVCPTEREGRPLIDDIKQQRPTASPRAPASAAALGWGKPIKKVDRASDSEERGACPPDEISV